MLKWVALGPLLLAFCAVAFGSKVDPQLILQKTSAKLQRLSALQLPPVAERFEPDFPANSFLPQTKSVVHQLAGGCQPGFTGSDCSNPICYNKTYLIEHDGTADFGDLVESSYSQQCSDIFTFYVDNFMNEFYLIINAADDGNPKGTVLNSLGAEVEPCSKIVSESNSLINMFCTNSDKSGSGLYSVKLQTETNGACIFEIRSPTKLAINGGFVADQRDDKVQQFISSKPNQGVFRLPDQNVNSYFAYELQSEVHPVHAETIHLYRSGLWDTQYNITSRYGCSASHITSPAFNCTSSDLYHVKVQGYDDGGNGWQRIYDFECNVPLPPTGATDATTPTNTPPTGCVNGGTIYANGCYCGEFFSGTFCEISLCMNGGTFNDGKRKCDCPSGYTGDHCEHVSCTVQSTDIFNDDTIAIGFVIRSASSMRAQIAEIAESASQIGKFISSNYPSYVQNFVLTVVQNNSVIITNEYTSSDAFSASIKSLTTPPTETECDDALMLGVVQTVTSSAFQKYPHSSVFVFSDGVANDDINVRGYLMEKLVETQAQVYFVLTDSPSAKCIVDVSSNQFQDIRAVTRLSRGLLIQTNVTQIQNATLSIAQDIWQLDTLIMDDLEDCRKTPTYQPFFVDGSIDYLVLRATGTSLSPIITLPNHTQITPDLYYSNGNLFIWRTSNPPLGAYLLNVNSDAMHSSVCQYRLMGRSVYHLYTSIAKSLNTDEQDVMAPVYNDAFHLVAKLNHMYIQDPFDTTVEVSVWYNDPQTSQRQVMYSSSGFWRDHCQYDLYFGMFACGTPNLPFYINVYATDLYGNIVLRTITNYCAAAPSNPSDADCLNGGVSSNGTCYCTSHFNGIKCQQIVCENGGQPLFGACQCVAGFSGQFCESAMCSQYNPSGILNFTGQSLTLMVHDSLTTRATLRTLNDVTPRVVNDIIQQHPDWISNYQLVRFNDTNFEVTVDSKKGSDLVKGVTNLYNSNRQQAGYSCKDLDLYAALLQVLANDNVQWGGILYIFLYGVPIADYQSYAKILQIVEINKIQINVVQSSLNPCGQDITSDGLLALTQVSGGSFVTASAPNAGNVLAQVPSHYMSGLVYETSIASCSYSTFYIPVDDGTQSFTTYIQGNLVMDPVYTAPDNSTVVFANLYTDIGTGSRMDHIVRPCDEGWFAKDTHCFKYSFQQMSWFDAVSNCHRENAVVATVFNRPEQDALDENSIGTDYWIGLNDVANIGFWVWDTNSVGYMLSLNDTQYTFWQPNQPDVQPDKRCVYDSNRMPVSGWATADCNSKKFYVCMKNAYSTEFEPTNPSQNHLPRGIWKVQVSASGPCSIAVRAQSFIQVVPKFITNIHDDFGNSEPNQNTNNNKMIVEVSGLLNNRAVEFAHFYDFNFTIIQAHTMTHRTNCLYSFLSTSFACPNFAFQMLITGLDDAGFLYQRIVPARCIGGADANSCFNGGVFSQGACICPPSFYGDTCSFAVCMNGGTLSASLDRCDCPMDFTGQFCELPVCTRNQNAVPDVTSSNRAFVLAVDGSSNGEMANVLKTLNDTLAAVFATAAKNDPNWFTSFVGIVFRDAESVGMNPPVPSTSQVFYSNNSDTFIGQIMGELAATPYTAKQPRRDVFTALVKTITNVMVVPNSQAFVITTGNAEDTVDEGTVMRALSHSHSSVNFLFIGDSGPPGDGKDYDDPSVATMFETAHVSGGAAYQLPSADSLKTTWQGFLNTIYRSYTILTHHLSNCSNYVDYIQLDANGTNIVVDLFAQSATDIDIRDTDGNVPTEVAVVKSKTNTVTAFSQSGKNPGLWTLDIDKNNVNPGSCLLNVRGQSPVIVNIGFTQDTLIDGGFHDGGAILYPLTGASNAVVAQATGGILTYVQLYDNEETRLAWAAPLLPRSSCAFNYISQRTFTCQQNSFILTIDGLDFEGHPFRRSFSVYCDGIIPPPKTTLPPAPTSPTPSTAPVPSTTALPTCDPLTPKVDIIIALDSSSTMAEDVFYHTVGVLKSVDSAISLAGNASRVTIGTYDSVSNFAGDLNTIDTDSAFTKKLLDLLTTGYTGINGNNLDSMFEFVSKLSFRDAARKIVFFISSQGWDKGNFDGRTSKGYPDPTAIVQNLTQAGVEFFAVGFGAGANMGQLRMISKCTQTAGDEDGVQNAINIFISTLCSPTPVC